MTPLLLENLITETRNRLLAGPSKIDAIDFSCAGVITLRHPISAAFEAALSALALPGDFLRLNCDHIKSPELKAFFKEHQNAQTDFLNSPVQDPDTIWTYGPAPVTDVDVLMLCRHFWPTSDLKSKLVVSLWDPNLESV